MPSIFEGHHKARKVYRCNDCGQSILVGELYWRAFGSSDDAMKNPPPSVIRSCKRCDLALTYGLDHPRGD